MKNDKKSLISIIVPVYNGEMFLKRCIDSLLIQTYPNIEIVIVNDGSTDGTREILNEYADSYNNIVAINKENSSLPQARKTGIENAAGEYIGFVDVDDWVEADMFEQLYTECVKENAQVSCCGFFSVYENKRFSSNEKEEEQIFSGKQALVELHKLQRVYPYLWNKLYKREIFQNVIFPTGNFIGEDYNVIAQVFCKASKIVWLPKPLYHYIQLEKSMSHSGYSDKYVLAFHNYETTCFELCRLYPKLEKYFINHLLTKCAIFVVAMGKSNKYNYEMLKKIRKYALKYKKIYLQSEYIEKKLKISIFLICIHYKALIIFYKIFTKLVKIQEIPYRV